MPLTSDELSALAQFLDAGRLDARAGAKLTDRHPELTIDEAYAVQERGMALRFARGEKRVGYKMGLTSQAKREQMGLHSPVYGELTDRMAVRETYRLVGQIHPKIEPEIAFLMRDELRGSVTRDEVLAGCAGVCAAMEILDSRYVGFKYFSLPDVIADNSSSSQFVLGTEIVDPRALDLANLEMVMSVDGAPVERALSSVISGDPVVSVVQLCELLAARGHVLPAGSVVLAGAATTAVQLAVGQRIELAVHGLGVVRVDVAA